MNIIRAGAYLVAYEFVMILCYIFLSYPASTVIQAITTAGTDMGVTQMVAEQTLVNNVLTICFVMACFIPIIWFMVEVMRREPDWRMYR